MDYSWAKVGAKVVCMEDEPNLFRLPGIKYTDNMGGLTAGEVYSIREFLSCRHSGRPVILLSEIYRNIFAHGETGFDLSRFKPLITKDQDVDLFKSLLNPTQQDHDELLDHELTQLTAAYARDAANWSAGI